MPIQMRKLSVDEATRAFPTRGEMGLPAYTDALRTLQVGDSVELALAGLLGRAAKRRLGQAATQAGFRLKWVRVASEQSLYFQVLTAAARTLIGLRLQLAGTPVEPRLPQLLHRPRRQSAMVPPPSQQPVGAAGPVGCC